MNALTSTQGTRKSKLFLSCGQNHAFGEPEWVEQIEAKLVNLGFDVFYALDRQDSKSLTENIFSELREADYYLFIDFKREAIQSVRRGKSSAAMSKEPKRFRGSLFTHQEFAIACFLGLEMMAFREDGVEPLTGVIGAVMGNPFVFQHRSELPSRIYEEVSQRIATAEWSTVSCNRLEFTAAKDSGGIDTWTDPWTRKPQDVSHYHINVANCHHRKAATNCYAYVEEIFDTVSQARIGPDYTCELKWEGTQLQGVRIGPRSRRGLDAFVVLHNEGNQTLAFWPHTDATSHIHCFDKKADLKVTYVVCSDEFPDARQTFRIVFNAQDIVSVTEI